MTSTTMTSPSIRRSSTAYRTHRFGLYSEEAKPLVLIYRRQSVMIERRNPSVMARDSKSRSTSRRFRDADSESEQIRTLLERQRDCKSSREAHHSKVLQKWKIHENSRLILTFDTLTTTEVSSGIIWKITGIAGNAQ